jgi:hypothetical protein
VDAARDITERGRHHEPGSCQFYHDLEQQLVQWKDGGKEIILMIDANEPIGEKPGRLTSVISKAGLTDLIRYRHPHEEDVNTHIRGSKQIDFIFGSQGIRQHCDRAGILPFGYGYQSDHRAIFIKIKIENILATTVHPIDSITARKLTQATPKERKIFMEEADRILKNQNLYERLKKLAAMSSSEWDNESIKEYEQCDRSIIECMLTAETKTKKTKTTSWSPAFAKAVNKKAFWKVALSLKMTHKYPPSKFIQWAQSLGIQDFHQMDITIVKQQLRQAQTELREIEKRAATLREEHLRDLLTEAELNGDEKQVQRRLQIILRAHEQRQHFRRLKSIFKPSENGGLTYVLVPENFAVEEYPYDPNTVDSWEAIHDQNLVQQYIQRRNIIHFGQAKGTPFTEPPISDINWQANSIPANEILNGVIPMSFISENPYVEKILKYMANRANLPEIDTHITPEQVCRGLRRWRENTSTSPSGYHLGLRRIATYPAESAENEEIRQNIIQAQTDIMNIPIQQGYSPSRWQTVINAMLEKIPGKPLLHKLRVIHILEADYNLALKQIFGK